MKTWDELLRTFRSRHLKLGETEAMVELAQAYRDLTGEHRWKFLLAETLLRTEAAVSYGTVAINNLSQALTLTPGSGGEVWSASWRNRRIVIDGRPESYKIMSFGSTTTATLEQLFVGDTVTAAAYAMYRSEYAMPADCDYGSEMQFWDVANAKPLPLVSAIELKDVASLEPSSVGYPRGIARVQLEPDPITSDVIEMVELFPAPDAAYAFPGFYFKRPLSAGPALGTAKPLWPAGYEDLIVRRAEINLEQNPAHRVVLSPELKQQYYGRLWDLKKKNDGGAEIIRRLSLANQYGWGSFFRNMNFSSTGINPLVGG